MPIISYRAKKTPGGLSGGFHVPRGVSLLEMFHLTQESLLPNRGMASYRRLKTGQVIC